MHTVRRFAALPMDQKIFTLLALTVAAVAVVGTVTTLVAPSNDPAVCKIFRDAC